MALKSTHLCGAPTTRWQESLNRKHYWQMSQNEIRREYFSSRLVRSSLQAELTQQINECSNIQQIDGAVLIDVGFRLEYTIGDQLDKRCNVQ